MMFDTASGGACAASVVCHSGTFKTEGGTAPLSFKSTPIRRVTLPAQGPLEILFDTCTHGSKGAAHYGYLFTRSC
jgi:hypothetical protein